MNRVDHETEVIGVNTIAPGELLPRFNIASVGLLPHITSFRVVGTLHDIGYALGL